MKQKKISIIIPVYNIGEYIQRCLNSIINQDYTNYEVIIVDDGSKDNVVEIYKNNYKKYDNIKYYYQKNNGQGSARNVGLEKATGEYIMFVDGDDYIEVDTLSKLNKIVLSDEYEIVCFNYIISDKNGLKKCIANGDNKSKSKKYIISKPSPCNKIYKKRFLVDVNFKFPTDFIYEDLAAMPTLGIYTDKIFFIDEYLYYYCLRNNSTMRISDFNKNRDDKFKAVNYLINEFEKSNACTKFYNELEYVCIKHMLIVYSTEILTFRSDIYKYRMCKAIDFINEKFPDWENNEYLEKSSKFAKIFLNLIRKKMWNTASIIVKIAKKTNKI